MMKHVTSYVCACLALLLALPVQAQEQVTVREINEIPQENIDQLEALGGDVTEEDLMDLVESPYKDQTVQFTAVVLAEPISSGLGTVDDNGLPGRVHFFVRDTAAASLGPLGMDIQVVDGNPGFQEKGLLGLFKGDVVTITAVVGYFDWGLQIEPETVEFEGDYQSLGLPESLLDPVPVTTSDLHINAGGTSQRIDWQNFVDYNQTFVRIEGATVWRSPNRTDSRPDWAITSDGAQTILQNDDVSICFRNNNNDYPDTFNTECFGAGNEFVAPPPGALVDVEGFVLLRADWDPFNIGAPSAAMYKIAPWEKDDLVITEEPSITSVEFSDIGVVGDDAIDVTINVEGDFAGVVGGELVYQTSEMAEADSLELTDNGDGTFTAQIPAQADGTFIRYSASVTHEGGTEFAPPFGLSTRVLYDGINEIEDVQEPWAEMGDESPFAGHTVPMDLTATVQSDPSASGIVVVQDDSDFGAYSGVLLSSSAAVVADLQTGDVINITEATVVENRDVTELDDVVYEKQSTGDPLGYKVVDSSMLQDDEIAEAHEGMMVRFEDAIILQPDAGFGEWSFSSDGSEENEVFADDQSDALTSSFNDRFSRWERIDVMQGVWWYSFGAYKLLPESEGDVGEVTNVSAEDDELPGAFALKQNYPNPFNPATSITFTIPQQAEVTLEVFDMLGRSVDVLVSENRPAGTYEVRVDGTGLSSGVYVYRLTAGDDIATRKMILMK